MLSIPRPNLYPHHSMYLHILYPTLVPLPNGQHVPVHGPSFFMSDPHNSCVQVLHHNPSLSRHHLFSYRTPLPHQRLLPTSSILPFALPHGSFLLVLSVLPSHRSPPMAHIYISSRRARGGLCEAMDMKKLVVSRQVTDPLTAIIGITFDCRSQQGLT